MGDGIIGDDGQTYDSSAPDYGALLKSEVYRIEALRAASRVVAARSPRDKYPVDGISKSDLGDTIWLAEQFARWLETGER